VNRREELRKRWAEYQWELDTVKEKAPENVCLKTDAPFPLEMKYFVENDCLEITTWSTPTDFSKTLSLSGGQAEKLYQFLGGLYGE
jgi:hypothetical protein